MIYNSASLWNGIQIPDLPVAKRNPMTQKIRLNPTDPTPTRMAPAKVLFR